MSIIEPGWGIISPSIEEEGFDIYEDDEEEDDQ